MSKDHQAQTSKAHANSSKKTKVNATEAATALRAQLDRVGAVHSHINEARSTGVVTSMRNGAYNAEQALMRLVHAREMFEQAAGPKPSPLHEDLLHRAELDELQLRSDIARLRLQADDVERATTGPLGQLPQGELQTSPEAIRRQAMENAPPGLCDDALMHDTAACPLDDTLRATNRSLVEHELSAIAVNWADAISFVHTDARFRSLAEKDGGHSMVELLLDVALSFVGGHAAVSALKAGAKLAGVGLDHGHKVIEELVGEIGKKVGETAAKRLGHAEGGDNLDSVMLVFEHVRDDWARQARMQVRHLPDAALTALGAGLKAAPLPTDLFVHKLRLLLSRFATLDKKLGKSFFGATMTAWVVHPTAGGRLALVQEDMKVLHHRPTNTKGGEPYEEPTGLFRFVGWVDHALESVALGMSRERRVSNFLALTTTDSRWADPNAKELAAWDRDSTTRDDVTMFENS